MKSKIIRTKTALAKALGVSIPTVSKYLSIPGAPKKGHRGWDLAEVSAWVAEQSDRESTLAKTSDSLRAAKLREISLRCDRMAFRLAKEKGEYVGKAEIAAAITRVLAPAVALLEGKLLNELPIAVAGLDPAQARIYARRLFDAVCEAMQKLAKEFPE